MQLHLYLFPKLFANIPAQQQKDHFHVKKQLYVLYLIYKT